MLLLFVSLFAALLSPLPGLLLYTSVSPDGTLRVERRLEPERGGRTRLLCAGKDTLDLGLDFFPAGWSEDGAHVLGYRLIEDGHDLLAALPEARDLSGAARAWGGAPGGFDRVLDAALSAARERGRGAAPRRARDAATSRDWPGADPTAPSGCPGWIICVDPGHGGPGAAQWNGVNGDGAGSHGPGGLTEQWVNLRVSRLLVDRLNADPRFVGSFLTRTTETEPITLADRVLAAAAGVADLFLSVHHNGLPAGTPNRTEAYYCRANPGFTNELAWGAPARLAHDRIVDAFGYNPRGALEDSSGSGRFHFYVLRHSPCISALTEASNLNGDVLEEDLFGRDPAEAHARAEALALHQALVEQFGYPTGVHEGDEDAAAAMEPSLRLDARFSPDGAVVEIDWSATRRGAFDLALFDVRGRRIAASRAIQGPGGGRVRLQPAGMGRNALPAGVYWLAATESGTLLARRRLIRTR